MNLYQSPFSALSASSTIDLSKPHSRASSSNIASAVARGGITPDLPTTAVARAAVCSEYASLRFRGHCPLGVYVIPSDENLLVWDAVLFVHQGYYADSILRFRLTFPLNYPERPPAVHFTTDVFHPLVAQKDGAFNLAPRFRTWRPKENHVFDVLHWVKTAFKKHALDQVKESDCFNKEAYRLYHDSTQSFAALATQTANLSTSASALFDRDHPSVTGLGRQGVPFRQLKSEKLNEMRESLGLQPWDDENAEQI